MYYFIFFQNIYVQNTFPKQKIFQIVDKSFIQNTLASTLLLIKWPCCHGNITSSLGNMCVSACVWTCGGSGLIQND